MIVALTGTPGTGKSTVGKHLAQKSRSYTILDINEIVTSKQLFSGFDAERQTQEVDLEALNDFLTQYISAQARLSDSKPGADTTGDSETIFLEGHISHHLRLPELVIVLRCHPKTLKERLAKRSWHDKKIHENLEAEAVDVILVECMKERQEDKIFEIDTTNDTPEKVVNKIVDILSGSSEDYKPGKIDWSEEILEWF